MTAEQVESRNAETILPAGTQAPQFTLPSTPGKSYSLSDFKGKPVVLAFYPADWSPVCRDQVALYNEMLDEFASYNAQIFGVSVDGVWCHKAFAENRRIRFPLLADFEPKGEIAKKYGAYREKEGIAELALFVIDEEGKVFWSYCSPVAVNPGADGVLDALDRLSAQKKGQSNEQVATRDNAA